MLVELLTWTLLAWQQDLAISSPLTNEGVIALARAGFDELFVAERIAGGRVRFDISVEGLVALKKAGVTEDLIRRMVATEERRRARALDPGPPALRLYPPPGAPPGAQPMLVKRRWYGYRVWELLAAPPSAP